MTTTNMPYITDYPDMYRVEETTCAYHESASPGYDPQKASYTYPTPETYSNARGLTASKLFIRKKEVAKEQYVQHAYSCHTVCCGSRMQHPCGKTSKCRFSWTENIYG